jgi:hypothetical protein
MSRDADLDRLAFLPSYPAKISAEVGFCKIHTPPAFHFFLTISALDFVDLAHKDPNLLFQSLKARLSPTQ